MSSKKIRLLHLIKSLDLGGIEKSTVQYSNVLQEKLDFVGIYASKGFYDNSDFINRGIKRFYPQYPIRQKKYFFKNLYNLLSILRQNEISHLHYHHRIFIPYIFSVKLFLPKIKVIYTHHSVFNDKFNNFIIGNKIIALNEATKQDLPKRFWGKTTIIPHGIQRQKNFNEQSSSSKNIGYVGRFVKEKGLLDLIKSFENVNEKIPNTKLIFVGNGPLKNEMIKYIDKLGLVSKVIFQKISISENEIYSDIDVLVLPSKKLEGFGLVVLEAMGLGIPVIVNNLAIFSDLIIDKQNGVINKRGLTQEILYLIGDQPLYNKIQYGAYSTVSKNFDIKKIVKSYLDNIYI